MRVALAGKGGAGKTTLSASLARLIARRGIRVVAIDADTNPNLAVALGTDAEALADTPCLSASLVSRRLDGPALTCTTNEVLDAHATESPDGVLIVRMGMPQHTGEGCLCSAHATASALLADLGTTENTVTIMDLEASPEHLSRGTARHADILLLVAEPYFRSLETVRRQAELAAELPNTRVMVVANKIRDVQDAEAISEFCERMSVEVLGTIPWSEEVMDADRAAVPLIDHSPDGPAAVAIGHLASELLALGAACQDVRVERKDIA